MSTTLHTDQYEYSMLASFIESGIVNRPAAFEAFTRKLPTGRTYGTFAGLDRITEAVQNFTFDDDQIEWLHANGIIDNDTLDYLSHFRFTGSIDALREGDLYFPNTPVLTVTGTLGECVLLETLILSILNHDCAVASAASRMVDAANGRPLIEMGSRRVHEEAAVAAARAAYIAGFTATSNLEAGKRHGIPTTGTAAHAFTLAHSGLGDDDDPSGETAAFHAQIATHGTTTTLLVDTYDIEQGIRHAVAAAQAADPAVTGPGGIRIDSGDLAEEAANARRLLDDLGATDTRIVVTSDLDEYTITRLADSPVDGYGAGTRLSTGSGHPTAGFVYKLVAIADDDNPNTPMRSVAKKAAAKTSVGGRKLPYREYDDNGTIVREFFTIDNTTVAVKNRCHLIHVPVMRQGKTVHEPSIDAARRHHSNALNELPDNVRHNLEGEAYLTAELADH